MRQKKILIADKMRQKVEKVFKENNLICDFNTGLDEAELVDLAPDYDAIVVRSATKITKNIIDAGNNLRVLGRAGIGTDNIDIKAATDKGIVVMNTPYGNSITTAEHTISLMMSLARNIPQANQSTKKSKWEKSKFMGTELFGKFLGLIGCGNIGSLVVERCIGLKMKVLVFDPFLSEEQINSIGATKVNLEELLNKADFISLHTPLTDETKGILNKENILKCKKGVKIINCARGGLIIENDLLNLLETGHVSGAALDVYDEEPPKNQNLFKPENLILTPHLGASTSEAQENVAVQIAEQISDYLLRDVIVNSINVSPISMEDAPKLKPFLDLALKLGKLGGQLIDSNITKINITFKGELANFNTKPLLATLLAGIFSDKMESVNLINSEIIAEKNDIDVVTSFQEKAALHVSEIEVIIKTDNEEVKYAGSLFAGKSRVVSMMGMRIEADISSSMLFISNNDKPGFIGSLGTLLGQKSVNIATFHLGRTGEGDAIALLELDQPIDNNLITLLGELRHVKKIKKLIF